MKNYIVNAFILIRKIMSLYKDEKSIRRGHMTILIFFQTVRV